MNVRCRGVLLAESACGFGNTDVAEQAAAQKDRSVVQKVNSERRNQPESICGGFVVFPSCLLLIRREAAVSLSSDPGTASRELRQLTECLNGGVEQRMLPPSGDHSG